MKLQNFPQDIYVSVIDEGTDDEFKVVFDSPEDAAEINEDINVGHYVLKESLAVTSEVKTSVTSA